MKKRFIKAMFLVALMFGFSFGLASCKKDNPVEPDPVTPVTPDPVTPVTPDPVTPVTPDPVTPVTPVEPESKILDKLPDGYYADLIQLPNSVKLSFDEFQVDLDYEIITIFEDSYLNIGYVDDTLKANGYLHGTCDYKLRPYTEDYKLYFSLDDEFIGAQFTSTDLDYSFVPEKDQRSGTLDEDDVKDGSVIYKQIKLSKAELFNKINAYAEKAELDFDINEIDSIDDITSLVGIPDTAVLGAKVAVNSLLNIVMPMLFDNSFAEDEITLSLKFDSIKMINFMLKELTIENIVDKFTKEGTFDKLVSLLTKTYSVVDQTVVKEPLDDKQYFVYDEESKEYDLCGSLTEWAPDTVYYVLNKDLGQYTIADLLITSEEDETGFVSTADIDAALDKVFELINEILPVASQVATSINPDMKLPQSFSKQMVVMLFGNMIGSKFGVKEYEMYESVTGLTEFVPELPYSEQIYFEVKDLTEFDSDENYFVKENDKYVLVDTTKVTKPQAGVTYYEFDPYEKMVNTKKALTPVVGTTYYLYENTTVYDENEITFITEWDENTTYYTFAGYDAANITEFAQDTTYYVKDEFDDYIPVEGEFDSKVTYYVESYEQVNKEVVTAPALSETYFVLDEGNYFAIDTSFDSNTTYYKKVGDKFEKVTDNSARPEKDAKYVVGYEMMDYVPYTDLVKFDSHKTYYIASQEEDGLVTYTEVETTEMVKPDSTKTYYTITSSFANILASEAIQKLTVNQILTLVYQMKEMSSLQNKKFDTEEEAEEAFNEIMTTKIDLVEMTDPYVNMIKEMKLYDVVAMLLDLKNPVFVKAEVGESFANGVEYYVYNETEKEYEPTADTTPVEKTEYYVIKARTAKDVETMIDDFADMLTDSLSLEIVTDNKANLKKIELELNFDVVKGGLTVEFNGEYTDTLKDELVKYIPYANENDEYSTELFEAILTDDIFKNASGNSDFKVIKDDAGKIIGIKEKNLLSENVYEYYFGKTEVSTKFYSSEKDYYADNIVRYHVRVRSTMDYNGDGEPDFTGFNFLYDLTTKKIVADNEFDYYIYNNETKEYNQVTKQEYDNAKASATGEALKPFIKKKVSKLTGIAQYSYTFYPKKVEATTGNPA